MDDLNNIIIRPTTISLLTTYQCTSSCKNCCFKCNPHIKARLTIEQMKSYVDQCLLYYEDSIKVLVLTGGECVLLGEDLKEIISYAANRNLIVRIVTNGYWASTLEKADTIITELKGAGLKEINFSTGDDHQEWVPYENIVNGAIASIDNGLTCVINVETHDKSSFKSSVFFDDERLSEYLNSNKPNRLIITNGLWIPFQKNVDFDYNKTPINKREYNRCTSLFNTIAINPFSKMLACCGLTCEYIPVLRLGDLNNHTIKELYENQFLDLLKIWLYTDGPCKILEFIYNKRGLRFVIKGHICDMCAEIFKDSKNIDCLRENIESMAPSILLKYHLLLKMSKSIDMGK